jgi:demethylmenaquinone methyltransferase / 2-methoxy-6-polyprenyl-1,4-benzoquinol methylase
MSEVTKPVEPRTTPVQMSAHEQPHPPLTEFYHKPAERAEYIAGLFDHSAQHYDWISGVLAFGTDRFYRKHALKKAGLAPGMRLLDVATGTGLVARSALELGIDPKRIVGLDPSAGMLKENLRTTAVPLLQGIGEKLPFIACSFDFISMGYALRHVESLSVLFAEFQRVLKPGGRLLLLEISRPDSNLLRAAIKLYMASIVPLIARLRTNSAELRELLRYYWATIDQCVPPHKIVDALEAAGFTRAERRRCGPMLNDYFAQK